MGRRNTEMGENFTGVKNQKLTRLAAVLAAVVLVASAADLALVQPPELQAQLAGKGAGPVIIYGRPQCLVPQQAHTGIGVCRTGKWGGGSRDVEGGGRQAAARSRGGALLRLLPVGPLPVHQASHESAQGDGLYQGEGAVSGDGLQGRLAG